MSEINTWQRQSTVIVEIPDYSHYTNDQKLLDRHNAKHKVDSALYAVGLRTTEYGIVRTPCGIFAFCSEGVGSRKPISMDNPLALPLFPDIPGFKVCSSFCEIMLRPKDLNALPVIRSINLATFIRDVPSGRYDHRLNQNFRTWNSILTTALSMRVIYGR